MSLGTKPVVLVSDTHSYRNFHPTNLHRQATHLLLSIPGKARVLSTLPILPTADLSHTTLRLS